MAKHGADISSEIQLADDVEIGDNVIIAGKGRIDSGVKIGNGVIIEGNFQIGRDTRIDHYNILRGNFEIGSENWIYPFCVIGAGAQHLRFPEDRSNKFPTDHAPIVIGSKNIIREYTTVHLPTVEKTTVGSNCYIMAYCHIAHDCTVHDNVTMANQSTLGGHAKVEKSANIGLNVSVHQFCQIGQFSMIGMGSTIIKDVLPYSLIINQKFSHINKIGMQRNKIPEEEISGIEKFYRNFEHDNNIEEIPYQNIQTFIQNSKRDFYRPEFD